MTTATRYTLEDVGCYVDGARGIYAVDRIVEIAEEHGMTEPEECTDTDCPHCNDHESGDERSLSWTHCLYDGEIEDEATEYMNDHHGLEGAYWGRSEAGDWGLWECEEE